MANLRGVISLTLSWTSTFLACAVLWYTLVDFGRPHACETTYIWEGYEVVNVPALQKSRYSLVRYVDKDPSLDSAEVLSPLSATPVLFVHGHLGSYQQMRSLAAESGRQVLREAGSRDADSCRGIVWYALDFGAEPSALDLSLLATQTNATAEAARYLAETHRAAPLIVGHSTGGLVAQVAAARVHREGEGASENDTTGLYPMAVVKLASPALPFPLLSWPPRDFLWDLADATRISNLALVSVSAGAKDELIPDTLTRRSLVDQEERGEAVCGDKVALAPVIHASLSSVPGAWLTATHKGILSCNQLVRPLTQALVGALLAPDPTASTVARSFRNALTTSLGQALARTDRGIDWHVPLPRQWRPRTSSGPGVASLADRSSAAMASDRAPADHALFLVPLRASSSAVEATCFLSHGQLIRAEFGRLHVNGTWRPDPRPDQLQLQPLPPPVEPVGRPGLLASLAGWSPAYVPRHWVHVMAGVNWMANATWIGRVQAGEQEEGWEPALQMQYAGAGSTMVGDAPGVDLAEAAALSWSRTLVHALSNSALVVQRKEASQLPIIALVLPSEAGCSQERFASFLHRLLVGSLATIPLKATARCASQRVSDAASPAHPITLVNARLGRAPGSSSDAVCTSSPSLPCALPLWPAARPHLVAVGGPGCQPILALRSDVHRWLATTLRQHARALPAVGVAMSMHASLRPLPSAVGPLPLLVLLLCLQAAAAAAYPLLWKLESGFNHPLTLALVPAGYLEAAACVLLTWGLTRVAARLSRLGLAASLRGALLRPNLARLAGGASLAEARVVPEWSAPPRAAPAGRIAISLLLAAAARAHPALPLPLALVARVWGASRGELRAWGWAGQLHAWLALEPSIQLVAWGMAWARASASTPAGTQLLLWRPPLLKIWASEVIRAAGKCVTFPETSLSHQTLVALALALHCIWCGSDNEATPTARAVSRPSRVAAETVTFFSAAGLVLLAVWGLPFLAPTLAITLLVCRAVASLS